MRKILLDDQVIINAFHEEATIAGHCFAYARMLNQLDYKWMRGRFDMAAQYESQSVMTPLVGRRKVLSYLRGKIESLKTCWPQNIVISEIGKDPLHGLPCVIVYQIQSIRRHKKTTSPVMYVMFQIDSMKLIKRCDLITCAPRPDTAKRSGIFPGANPIIVKELCFSSPVMWSRDTK